MKQEAEATATPTFRSVWDETTEPTDTASFTRKTNPPKGLDRAGRWRWHIVQRFQFNRWATVRTDKPQYQHGLSRECVEIIERIVGMNLADYILGIVKDERGYNSTDGEGDEIDLAKKLRREADEDAEERGGRARNNHEHHIATDATICFTALLGVMNSMNGDERRTFLTKFFRKGDRSFYQSEQRAVLAAVRAAC